MKSNVLKGITVLITREPSQAIPLADLLGKCGARTVNVPLISFRKVAVEPKIWSKLDEYNWLIFTSQNGVEYFFQQLKENDRFLNRSTKIAAVGTKTKELLEKYQMEVQFIPSSFTGDQLAREMKDSCLADEKILFVKGNLAKNTIVQVFQEKGYDIDETTVYETYLPKSSSEKLVELFHREDIDVITFTSPSTIDHFVKIAGSQLRDFVSNKVIACIGPVTEKRAKYYGIDIHISPNVYTTEQLVYEIVQYYSK